MKICKDEFGVNQRDQTVHSFELSNDQGMTVVILDRGAIIQSILVPDNQGRSGEVTLGCNTVEHYEQSSAYFGAVAGRYANRIAKGRADIAGQPFVFACNNGDNHLHGGNSGFDDKIWKSGFSTSEDRCTLTLQYCADDGEESYPGKLQVKVDYLLNNQNELTIKYQAETDKTTIINLTNHAYFNLRGTGSCREHRLQINADYYTPVDSTSIPYGDIASVAGTPMDFSQMKTIGQDIEAECDQLKQAGGYDHNWVFRCDNSQPTEPVLVARVEEPESGRAMDVLTTHPGVQFYSGNFLEGQPDRQGNSYHKQDGFCLETQHFPDSPNHPEFPSTELKPGDKYQHQTVFRFGVLPNAQD